MRLLHGIVRNVNMGVYHVMLRISVLNVQMICIKKLMVHVHSVRFHVLIAWIIPHAINVLLGTIFLHLPQHVHYARITV